MNIKSYDKIKLDNGITIYLVPMKNTNTVKMGFNIHTGSRVETAEIYGISHLIEHIYFVCGTKKRAGNKLIKDLESHAIEYNAYTSHDNILFHFILGSEDIKHGLDIMLDMYINGGTVNKKILNNEKNVIIQELTLSYIPYLESYIYGQFYQDTSLNNPVIGFKDTIFGITEKDIKQYVDTYFQPMNTSFIICGDFNKKQVSELLTKSLSKLTNSDDVSNILNDHNNFLMNESNKIINKINEQTDPRVLVKPYDSGGGIVYIDMIFSTHEIPDEARIPVNILKIVINERVTDILRNKMGIIYNNSTSTLFYETNFIKISTQSDVLHVVEILKTYISVLKYFKKTMISDKELKVFKKMGLRYLLDSSIDKNLDACFDTFVHLSGSDAIYDPEAEIREFESVTPEMIRELARCIFKKNRINVILRGNIHKTTYNWVGNMSFLETL
jgi:predicted Zn-dependent peptidase